MLDDSAILIVDKVVVPWFVAVLTAVPEMTPLNSMQVTIAEVGDPLSWTVTGLLLVSPLGTISSYMNAFMLTEEDVSEAEVTSDSEFEAWSLTDWTLRMLGVSTNDTTMRSPTAG
jgi:hypothetical protein